MATLEIMKFLLGTLNRNTMKERIWLLEKLRSDHFILYVAIFTVLFLTPNTYYVFYELSIFISPYREIASAGVSLIVASSILIYTLRKNLRMAEYYSWFEVSISSYYYITIVGWDWALIPALSFTIVLPVSVYYYAQELGDVTIDYNDPDLIKWMEENPKKRPSDYYKRNS
jgi:hypothetical protein